MGNSASTAFQTGYSLGTQQIEGQPSPLAAALGPPNTTAARSGRGLADDSDEPPALVDAGSGGCQRDGKCHGHASMRLVLLWQRADGGRSSEALRLVDANSTPCALCITALAWPLTSCSTLRACTLHRHQAAMAAVRLLGSCVEGAGHFI